MSRVNHKPDEIAKAKERLVHPSKVKQLLDYDAATGQITWRNSGATAGSVNNRGYRRICIEGALIRAHRIAWVFISGDWPRGQIDHINGQRDDNRAINLRVVSHRQNTLNKAMHRQGRRPGARREKGKWRVQVGLEGRQYHIGYFSSRDEAVTTYNEIVKSRDVAEAIVSARRNRGLSTPELEAAA